MISGIIKNVYSIICIDTIITYRTIVNIFEFPKLWSTDRFIMGVYEYDHTAAHYRAFYIEI